MDDKSIELCFYYSHYFCGVILFDEKNWNDFEKVKKRRWIEVLSKSLLAAGRRMNINGTTVGWVFNRPHHYPHTHTHPASLLAINNSPQHILNLKEKKKYPPFSNWFSTKQNWKIELFFFFLLLLLLVYLHVTFLFENGCVGRVP